MRSRFGNIGFALFQLALGIMRRLGRNIGCASSWVASGIGILLLLVSCAALQAPAPVRRAAIPRNWEVPPSTLVIPVRIPQAQLKAWTETAVPQAITGEGSGKRTLTAWFMKHDWHYWWTYDLRRGPLALTFQGSRIRVATSLTGDLSARWDTLPGDISSEVEAEAGAEADLVVGSDWKLIPKTKVFLDVRRAEVPIGIAWDGNFFGETISIAAPVQQALQPSLSKLSADLDKRLAAVDLRPAVEAAWRDLQEPRALPGSEDLWFTLGPQTVALGPLVASADFLSLDLALMARPSVSAGSRPSLGRTPLPSLGTPSGPTPGVTLHLPVSLNWDQAARAALGRLPPGGEIAMGTGGKFWVSSLAASTDGDRVLVRVEGKISPPWPGPKVDAVVWLGGRPLWDPVTRVLRLSETTLEVSTRDFLAKTAAWMLGGSWVSELEKSLRWETGPELDALRLQAASSLAALTIAPHLRLSMVPTSLEVVDFALTDEGPQILARIDGTASVDWIP